MMIALVFGLLLAVNADVYLQYPRGSNNRFNEANRERDNANRVFDSQNNNRGGYNAGSVYYYTGTVMNIEWTAQHSCGNPNANCEMVLQYMCDTKLRDGLTTTTIPITQNGQVNIATGVRSDLDPQFGRHESFASYVNCLATTRNKGLFTSNQDLNGNDATFTRQNNNGNANDNNRHGLECPEEREYYPYWGPTQWRDIAVLTNDPARCDAYQAASQNVANRTYCAMNQTIVGQKVQQGKRAFIPINEADCTTAGGNWTTVAAFGIPAPDCHQNIYSRDNHLGNVDGGFPQSYNWTVPSNLVAENCAIRMRYNVSTGEFAGFDGESVQANVDSRNNSITNPNDNADPAKIQIWAQYGLSYTDVAASFVQGQNTQNNAQLKNSRQYVLVNDPRVDIFGSSLIDRGTNAAAPKMIRLELAINTNQFGRTFQDRSFRVGFRQRTADLSDGVIHNVQVRGKRGNIVQVFPATEYDFFPNRLEVRKNDFIHFQWTGSDTNDNNNAGQGRAGTDRSNAVLLEAPRYAFAIQAYNNTSPATAGDWTTNYPAMINETNFLGFNNIDKIKLALMGSDGGYNDELNEAGTYFDLGPRQATANGIYHYVSTRNNNFSNRDQKGKIVVSATSSTYAYMCASGGNVTGPDGEFVYANPGDLVSPVQVGVQATFAFDMPNSISGDVVSPILLVTPSTYPLALGRSLHMNLPYTNKVLTSTSLLYTPTDPQGSWTPVSATFTAGNAHADFSNGGYYAVQQKVNWGLIVGIVLGSLSVIVIATFLLYRKYRCGHSKREARPEADEIPLSTPASASNA